MCEWSGREAGTRYGKAKVNAQRPHMAALLLSGCDSRTSSLDPEQYDRHIRYLTEMLAIGRVETVYEVGCGAGALLRSVAPMCARVGGSDFAPALVDIARSVLVSDDLRALEGSDVPVSPRYDVVVSNGVFIYFPDEDYARKVLSTMIAKARRTVGVFDVNDLATRDEYLAKRQEAYRITPGGAGRRSCSWGVTSSWILPLSTAYDARSRTRSWQNRSMAVIATTW